MISSFTGSPSPLFVSGGIAHLTRFSLLNAQLSLPVVLPSDTVLINATIRDVSGPIPLFPASIKLQVSKKKVLFSFPRLSPLQREVTSGT